MVTVASDRTIMGEGTPEMDWQAWPQLSTLPVISLAELVPITCRAVVIAPHPDDEVIGFGGLIALLAHRASPCLVIGVTAGEASHPGSQQWPSFVLASKRIEESRAGLHELGVSKQSHRFLSLPDGGLAGCSETLTQQLTDLLTPGDVVFSTWALDGHPDHEAVGQVAERVCTSLGCRHWQAPVWMWHWAKPADKRVPWQNMRRLALPESTLRQKKAALSAHQTQLLPQDTGAPAVLTDFALKRMLRSSEYFMPVGNPL